MFGGLWIYGKLSLDSPVSWPLSATEWILEGDVQQDDSFEEEV